MKKCEHCHQTFGAKNILSIVLIDIARCRHCGAIIGYWSWWTLPVMTVVGALTGIVLDAYHPEMSLLSSCGICFLVSYLLVGFSRLFKQGQIEKPGSKLHQRFKDASFL